jgi:hypothetical protein
MDAVARLMVLKGMLIKVKIESDEPKTTLPLCD